jgi:hypothetical protein
MTKYGQHQKTVKAFLTDAGRRSIQESRSSLLGYLVIAVLTSIGTAAEEVVFTDGVYVTSSQQTPVCERYRNNPLDSITLSAPST